MDEVVAGTLTPTAFVEKLGELGLSPAQMETWVDDLEARRVAVAPEPDEGAAPVREATPEGLEGEELATFRRRRAELLEDRPRPMAAAIEEIARRRLIDRIGGAVNPRPPRFGDNSREVDEFLASLVAERSTQAPAISTSLLSAAPHLAKLSQQTAVDPHVEETCRLRRAFSGEKSLDSVIDLLQLQSHITPLPRAIWKQVLLDEYVDFRKVYAAMEGGHEQYDEPKPFAGEYQLVKKDQFSKTKEVRDESEWTRVFAAWQEAVAVTYPHRKEELVGYRRIVHSIFRIGQPAAAIQFDVDARNNYAKGRFRLDDGTLQQPTILNRVFNAATTRISKRSAPNDTFSNAPPAKKPATAAICRNWNLGLCAEPCPGRRRHGACIECGNAHKSRDNEACKAAFQARRGT
ncbi:hypothetical protein DFP72DRAFT_1017536 [Ephemerocybe angulata]|uniref:Uncharacterized protein n=1 Tax=Ephemerocybe angulata TaxID=980116 RepID=A0A8H6HF06_9AGAR|nr:hypothetical protein DFP72DRAFT_1017536 [Tulosesus angulatus]